ITQGVAIQIKRCLKAGNEALIFLSRWGVAASPLCQDCGESLKCRYCDVTMTYHKGANEYRCHFCGFAYPEKVRCPKCKSRKIKPLGYGTQKIESILKKMFPEARLARMDQDSTSKKGSMIKILRSIRNRTVDIIVGTQMLAKGHDFPFITLVGIVCADLSLSLPDFRAGERTFQLLAQVAGRAGRGQTPGKVIMQTYAPDHFIIEASKRQDFINFFNNEAPFRKALQYPPYSKMIQIKISGNDFSRVKNHAMALSHGLDNLIAGEKEVKEKVQVLGPIEAPIQKISSRYRWQILLKSSSANLLNRLVRSVLIHPSIKSHKNISVAVDVDPYSLM
ncbi:MAG: primosomal protein N', partial [Desulfobacteraceae bacterium]|nr:primosomal protein N' [Desulfobacteraceae bacterium]